MVKRILTAMIGLIISIIVFNFIAFATNNKRLTKNQIVHIWTFTVALQVLTDTYIDAKYHGYWYFNQSIDLASIPAITMLVPAVNIIFLSWYPFKQQLYKRMLYIFFWVIAITFYEVLTLIPEPWGYFHHGWWRVWYSFVVNPFLLMIVVFDYKWICKIEK